jgi:hypothetical protein
MFFRTCVITCVIQQQQQQKKTKTQPFSHAYFNLFFSAHCSKFMANKTQR